MSALASVAYALVVAIEEHDPRAPFNADRLFKLTYLVDWKASLNGAPPISGITWTAEGPADLVGDVSGDNEPVVELLHAYDGQFKVGKLIGELQMQGVEPVSEAGEDALRFVIDQAVELDWRDLASLVFSTRPLLAGRHEKRLDLERFARDQLASMPHSATKFSQA